MIASTKLSYNPRVKCFRHSEYIAATCPDCYELALVQQAAQVSQARKIAHTEYLRRREVA